MRTAATRSRTDHMRRSRGLKLNPSWSAEAIAVEFTASGKAEGSRQHSALGIQPAWGMAVFSREAAQERSPRRKPWVQIVRRSSPGRAKELGHGRKRLNAECYRRNRPIKYITTDNTTLTRIEVASGK